MPWDVGAGGEHFDAAWSDSHAYFYAGWHAGHRQKRLAGGIAGGRYANHSREHIPLDVAARVRTDLLVWGLALFYALGWPDTDR